MQFLKSYFLLIVLLALIGFFALQTDNFFSFITLSTILSQLPALTFVAVGMTLVLIVGGIDLSVGALMALSSAIIGILMVQFNMPFALATACALLCVAVVGASSGYLSSWMRLPSFIVTLGVLEAARGLSYVISNSQTMYVGPKVQGLTDPIAGLGISSMMLLAFLVVIVSHIVLNHTVFGRQLIAIGSNRKAALMSGIKADPKVLMVFVISALLAGLAGLANLSYLGSSDPNAGIGLELSAIAAAVIGGTSLMGGRGTIIGTFLGVLIIAVLDSGLAQMGMSEPAKRMITGAVIILAVLLDKWRVKQ
ncbi:ABC transporter permease [Glaciecola siphonariae]|uniref:ABC transporter permease n=1 Tax=Glaciecola siphonariae TaxID=521012 RepID=A0ABV9LWF8_9ALTE